MSKLTPLQKSVLLTNMYRNWITANRNLYTEAEVLFVSKLLADELVKQSKLK